VPDLDLEHLIRASTQLPVGFPVSIPGYHRARRSIAAALVALGILLVLSAGRLPAQISPGPLAKPHRSLEGTTQCVSCHKFGAGEATFKCLECHTEIASRMAAHRGLHPNLVTQPASQDCARCHSDHNGENFNLIHWDPKAFDHNKAGYPLLGKHAGLACNQCHKPEHISAAERSTIRVKDLSRTYLGLSQSCSSCHQDPHKGRLGHNCAQCHNYGDWKQTSQFDHGKSRYPLTGLHEKVACQKCHTPGADNKPRWVGLPFGKCLDCHSDPHHGSFAQQSCHSCHTTSGWKRVQTATLAESFDHSKTKYPLVGKHQTVDCLLCHVKGDFKKPLAFAKCTDCHRPDPHGGQFAKRKDAGECSACHSLDGWKPSTFGLKEHQASAYPLQGKHTAVNCAKCHIPRGKDTLYQIKFGRCLDCHADEHQGQFAAAPHLNRCETCHTLMGWRPSTFTLARHNETRFLLTGSHIAVPCNECHKPAAYAPAQPKPVVVYHWRDSSCTTCHADPHKGQFRERMAKLGANATAAGCETCHSTKSWKDLQRFDHSATEFPLVGAHRAVECKGCHKPPALQTKLTNVDFRVAPRKCEECHEDIHGTQFANAQRITPCADCHNSARWKPSLFDHDKRTAFSLQGAHRNVRCGQCHQLTKLIAGKKVLFYKPTPKDCAACHGPAVKN
jgi:hypothetical protein